MKDKVQIAATYPHPPERVWEALTDPEALAKWLLPNDFKPLIGFRFRFLREGARIEGKVTDVEPGKLLAYTWKDDDDEQPSMVVWSLRPDGGGTRVELEHFPLEEPVVTCLVVDNYFNWEYALRNSLPGLLRLLAGQNRTPRPPIVYVDDTPKKELVKK